MKCFLYTRGGIFRCAQDPKVVFKLVDHTLKHDQEWIVIDAIRSNEEGEEVVEPLRVRVVEIVAIG